MGERPGFLGIYLFVRDLPIALSFYRLLGLEIEEVSDTFARAVMPNGANIEFGTAQLTRSYDPEWQAPSDPGSNTINFELASREAVDAMYEKLTSAGYAKHLPPCDPPWQSRFAIVDDPDGNVVGLNSPRDLESDRKRERA